MRSTHTGQTTKQKLGCVCVCVKIDSNEAHTMNGHRYRTTNCAVSARLLSLLCGKPDHDTFWHGKSIENIRIWFYFGLCAACFELQCFLFDLGEKGKIHHIVAYTHTKCRSELQEEKKCAFPRLLLLWWLLMMLLVIERQNGLRIHLGVRLCFAIAKWWVEWRGKGNNIKKSPSFAVGRVVMKL